MENRQDTDRFVLLVLGLFSSLAIYSLLQQALTEQGWFWPRRLQVAILLVGGNLIVGIAILLLHQKQRQYLYAKLGEICHHTTQAKTLGVILVTLTLSGTIFLVYGPYGQPFLDPIVRFWLFAQTTWWVGFLLMASGWFHERWPVFVTSLLLVGLGFNLGNFFSKISTHPFSLDWSETSRYYYASLFFAERIYGVKVAWSPLHPSRYLLQSIPFLLHPLPLWIHRLWQVILWIAIPAGTCWLLVRRLQLPRHRRLAWLYSYLFLMIGAVYYHLLIIPALILAFYKTHFAGKQANFLWGIALVTSSIWAGISRVNWLPMPAIIITTLYLLECPINGQKIWRYLSVPFVFSVISILIAMLSSAIYVKLSGNPPSYFASSFTSDLIWERLLPNPTYYSGILLPVIFVSIPVLLTIIYARKRMKIKLSWLRFVGLLILLFALFVVGVVVSAKIGGGSNLHNFDGYLVILWILLFYFLCDKVLSEELGKEQFSQYLLFENFHSTKNNPIRWQNLALNILFVWTVAAPLPFAIFQGYPIKTYIPEKVEEALYSLNSVVKEAAAGNQEVLFITERHLLTFGYLSKIPLVPEYEKVWLMEMAMANHREYLERFYADLANQRFAAIITTQTYVSPQGDSERFGDENRAWRKRVNRPILCYYKTYLRFREFNFEILVPREKVRKQCR